MLDTCRISFVVDGMIILTKQSWKLIQQVNARWNDRIEYQSDMEHYGKRDYWAIPQDGLGDCEDYVLAKKRALENQNISSCIATCWVETGGYHGVLVVRTDRGDYVLDNRYDQVWGWDDLPYEWDKMQREDGNWYAIV